MRPANMRHVVSYEPPRSMRADGYEWEHEIQVALPATYGSSDQSYPVLWVTDGSTIFHTAAEVAHLLAMSGLAPEMIVVGVGCAASTNMVEFGRRRLFEFIPTPSLAHEGPGARHVEALVSSLGVPVRGGGARQFLEFLVRDVRAAVAAEYRTRDSDHTLFGHSAGGVFVGYALLTQPEAFTSFICGSPAFNVGDFEVFNLEEQYAASHDDLPASVFFAAGETELSDSAGLWLTASMLRLAETLSSREYPSLEVTSRVFPGESHVTTIVPLLSWGLRTVRAGRLASAQP